MHLTGSHRKVERKSALLTLAPWPRRCTRSHRPQVEMLEERRLLSGVPLGLGPIVEAYGQLPLSFEANRGQADARAQFLSRSNGYTLLPGSREFGCRYDRVSRGFAWPTMAVVEPGNDGHLMKGQTMKRSTGIFEIEGNDRTLIITPVTDLRELNYQQIESGLMEILALLDQPPAKNVIIDLHKTDSYGSTALGFFVKVWKRAKSGNGNMAFCNISNHEMEILKITKLDKVWPICSSRVDALRAVSA